jgi:RNA polymerase sigma-70 factor, ECF subfamily
METDLSKDVTRLLGQIMEGREAAKEDLWRAIYDELRRMAEGPMAREGAGHLLQPTALVHEVFIRLSQGLAVEKALNRSYLFAAASRAMRQVLVDHARSRKTAKRGGGLRQVPLDDALEAYEQANGDVEALHIGIERLKLLDPRQAQIVDEYAFGGGTMEEIGKRLGISKALVSTEYKHARAWLLSFLEDRK